MPGPEPLSPLLSNLTSAGPAGFSGSGITLEERPFVRKLAIRGRADDLAFTQRFARILGVAPPLPGRSAAAGEAVVISVGSREWLAVALDGGAGPLASPMPMGLADAGIIVVDVSSATTILQISGSGCLATLQRLCALPFYQLGKGDAVRTRMGRLAILMHVLEKDRFDLFVQRSYAKSFFEQLRDAAELIR